MADCVCFYISYCHPGSEPIYLDMLPAQDMALTMEPAPASSPAPTRVIAPSGLTTLLALVTSLPHGPLKFSHAVAGGGGWGGGWLGGWLAVSWVVGMAWSAEVRLVAWGAG